MMLETVMEVAADVKMTKEVKLAKEVKIVREVIVFVEMSSSDCCKGSSIYYVIIFGGLGRPLPPYVICNHLGRPPPLSVIT